MPLPVSAPGVSPSASGAASPGQGREAGDPWDQAATGHGRITGTSVANWLSSSEDVPNNTLLIGFRIGNSKIIANLRVFPNEQWTDGLDFMWHIKLGLSSSFQMYLTSGGYEHTGGL